MENSTWIKNLPTPIAIIGLGKSGKSALSLLKAIGFADSVLLTYDEKDLAASYQSSKQLLAEKPKTLVISPGVPLKTDWIQSLVGAGAVLTSELSLTASLLTSEKVIGITGSVGKSTVVSILGEGAHCEDSNCFVGGNLGTPFCDYGLGLLQGKPRAHWIILELSSYQLENVLGLSLDFSAITFLSPNHLERYENLKSYYETKMKITSITKNLCVINKSSADAVQFAEGAHCLVAETNATTELSAENQNKLQLIGKHNLDNFSVAKKLATAAGWSKESLHAMTLFTGLPHRLENIGIFNGIQYINDSKATAIDSVLVATDSCLQRLNPAQQVFLLLGGKDKNLPWEQLHVLKSKVNLQFIFFGACGGLAQKKSDLGGSVFSTLGLALDQCLKIANPGDIVLLSPGGTSLDEFKNFEERGTFFKNKVFSFYKKAIL